MSCNFRYIIDEYFGIKELAIEHGNYKHPFLALKLEKGTISYMNSRSTRYACSVQVLGKRRKMKKGDSVDFVLNDLSNLMKDKVFKLDALKIEYPTWIYKDNLDVFVSTIPLILKSAKSLHVKEVEFRSGWSIEEMAQMLQCIEKVEGIEIHKPGPLDALVPLDQWKMAKSVIALDKQSLLDIGNIFHLHQFKLQLVRISREELVKIRDVSVLLFKPKPYGSVKFFHNIFVGVGVGSQTFFSLFSLIFVFCGRFRRIFNKFLTRLWNAPIFLVFRGFSFFFSSSRISLSLRLSLSQNLNM